MSPSLLPPDAIIMPPMRNVYFHSLHAYDLTATQRHIHELFNMDGSLISPANYNTAMELISLMKWTTQVDDNTIWPHLINPYRNLATPFFFELWGIEAALPEFDPDDVLGMMIMEEYERQGDDGEVDLGNEPLGFPEIPIAVVEFGPDDNEFDVTEDFERALNACVERMEQDQD